MIIRELALLSHAVIKGALYDEPADMWSALLGGYPSFLLIRSKLVRKKESMNSMKECWTNMCLQMSRIFTRAGTTV